MQKHTRYWEIDLLRGIALISMILYHFRFDLSLLGFGLDYPVGGVWQILVWLVAGSFLVLAGISLWLAQYKSDQQLLQRGVTILGFGLVVTLATLLVAPTDFVRFGILHSIGVSLILSIPFFRNILATRVMLLGLVLIWLLLLVTTQFQVDCSQCGALPMPVEWLMMVIGFWPPSWSSFDYYPLLPWWSVIVAGIALGQVLYPKGERGFLIGKCRWFICGKVVLLGQHSLLVYLMHQPVLIGVLLLLKYQFFQ